MSNSKPNNSCVVFSVLHYLAADVTARCVDSILSLKSFGARIHVVIVDNASSNDSVSQLKSRYQGDCRVHFILNEENAGFARGNNIGYQYAKRLLLANLIVVLNNDVVIEQPDFVERLLRLNESYNIGVIGPDVFNPLMNIHQSPLCYGDDMPSFAERAYKDQMKRAQTVNRHRLAIMSLKAHLTKLLRLVPFGQRLLDRRHAKYIKGMPSEFWDIRQSDVVVSGSCVVFGPAWIDKSDIAFDPRTFMFFEECLLLCACRGLGVSLHYEPELRVLHYHGVSTQRALSDGVEREKVIASYYSDSYCTLKSVLAGSDESFIRKPVDLGEEL